RRSGTAGAAFRGRMTAATLKLVTHACLKGWAPETLTPRLYSPAWLLVRSSPENRHGPARAFQSMPSEKWSETLPSNVGAFRPLSCEVQTEWHTRGESCALIGWCSEGWAAGE